MQKKTDNQTTLLDTDVSLKSCFTQDELQALKEVAVERLARGKLPMKIRFKREPPAVKTVRISKLLLDDAQALEPNFSKLVEIFLWKFLGSQDKYFDK